MEVTCLKQLAKFGKKRGLLPKDYELDYSMTKSTESDTYCYTDKDFTAILEQASKLPEPPWLYPVLMTAGLTGMRISELETLRWTDIDFAEKRIRIKDERHGRRATKGSARTTKGRKSRSVPIFRPLLEVLQTLPRHQDGFVFRGAKGARIDQDRVLRSFKRDVLEPLCATLPTPGGELGLKDGVIHGFRHYFISRMVRLKMPTPRIKKWVGHRSSRMVEYYVHLHEVEEDADIEGIHFLPDVVTPGLPLGGDVPCDSTHVA